MRVGCIGALWQRRQGRGGARLVWTSIAAKVSSLAVVVGRASDASMAEGEGASLNRGFVVDSMRLVG